METLVSVIVPVYNVENYLEECLNSIVSQTVKDIEVIIVNDASPDNSETIIRRYLTKYSNFIYIKHEKNLGINAARNTGLSSAQGKYILFIDSDDYIVPTMIEKMLVKAEENDLDVVMCVYLVAFKNNKFIYNNSLFKSIDYDEILDGYSAFRNYLLTSFNTSLWNKLFKKDIYIKSQEIMQMKIGKYRLDYNEDTTSNFFFFINAKRCMAIKEKLYIYRYNLQSAVRKPILKHFKDTIFVLKLGNEIMEEKIALKPYSVEYENFYFRKTLDMYIRYLKCPIIDRNTDIYFEITQTLDNYKLLNIIKNPSLRILDRIKWFLYKVNLLFFILNFKKFVEIKIMQRY
jgi:glycosyltransferase involved in cell wall biosynthesis